MREIKFRAWDGKHLSSVNALYLDADTNDEFIEVNCTCGCNEPFEYAKHEVTLQQYTGVRDKNNKEIYEGDVLFVTHVMVETIPTYSAVVEWDKYRFALRNLDINDNKFNMIAHGAFGFVPYRELDPFGLIFEVVGNVYENPELIKS